MERWRDRETERQLQGDRGTATRRYRERQGSRDVEMWRGREVERQRVRETERKRDR